MLDGFFEIPEIEVGVAELIMSRAVIGVELKDFVLLFDGHLVFAEVTIVNAEP